MIELMSIVLLAANFTAYPAFGNSIAGPGGPLPGGARVEVTTDKGPIIELIVRCPIGTAIISYSKLDRLYCSPRQRCDERIGRVVRDTCR